MPSKSVLEPSSRWVAGVLGLLVTLIVVDRSRTYHEPLERDITTYAIIAEGLLEGRKLYGELWDHKPPGIHAAYAAAQCVAGPGRPSIHLLVLVNAVATMGGVYTAARATGRGTAVGIWAAAFWVAISGNLHLQANQPNVEVFLNTCLIWCFALSLKNLNSSGEFRASFICGLLVGFAILLKPNAAAILLMFGVQLVRPSHEHAMSRKSVYTSLAITVASAVFVVGGAVLFFSAGCRSEFWDAVVVYNRFYAGDALKNLVASVHPQRLFHTSLRDAVPIIAAAILLPTVSVGNRLSRAALLTGAYGLSIAIAIALPGKSFPHYYQLWLPLLCVTGAWGIDQFVRIGNQTQSLSWRTRLCAVVLGLTLYLQLPAYGRTPIEWSLQKYGDVFVQSQLAGQWLDRILLPEEDFYNWGKETGLYFASGRQPPSGVFYNYPLLRGPLVDKLSQRLLDDLERNMPQVFVVSDEFPRDHVVYTWFSERYAPLSAHFDGFEFYVVRDGALADRLASSADGE